jgi:phosphoglycolate phosphatase-like HAD superfamily hydrolase
MVIVADSLYEIGLGVKSIGVAQKTWQAQLLKKAGASTIISSLDQLEDRLDQLL